MFKKGDRVCIGTEYGLVYGTVLKVAYDGEPKIQLDGNDDAMYYPVEAAQVLSAQLPENVHPINQEV